MKRTRFAIALSLVAVGVASTCFWVSAIRDAKQIDLEVKPRTPVEMWQRFPALAVATRLYGVDLFAPAYSEADVLGVICRLNGQLWRPIYISTVVISLGLLLILQHHGHGWWRKWLVFAGRIVVIVFMSLQLLMFVHSWIKRNDLPRIGSFPPPMESEPAAGTDGVPPAKP